ncbi:hypothetical protein FQA39_LY07218 [Lamprigera yunnana]|nr:hypothetical protein FQA39_LY07218 [Lamprigera yunnana]
MYERFMPSTSAMSLEYGGIRQSAGVKRKFDDDDCNNSYRRLRYYYQLASESSFSENSNESSYSCQAYETELCFDTPDTDTKSEYDSDSDINFEVEYDVCSSSNEDIQLNIDSSTENEDLVHGGTITALICEAAFEQGLTDGEESDNSSMADYESHRAVFDVCVQCKLPNNNLFFRYCKKCFQNSRNKLAGNNSGQIIGICKGLREQGNTLINVEEKINQDREGRIRDCKDLKEQNWEIMNYIEEKMKIGNCTENYMNTNNREIEKEARSFNVFNLFQLEKEVRPEDNIVYILAGQFEEEMQNKVMSDETKKFNELVRQSFFPPRPRGKKRHTKSSATLVLKQSNPIMSHSLDLSQEKEKQRASTHSGTPNSDNGVSEKTSSFEENETSERDNHLSSDYYKTILVKYTDLNMANKNLGLLSVKVNFREVKVMPCDYKSNLNKLVLEMAHSSTDMKCKIISCLGHGYGVQNIAGMKNLTSTTVGYTCIMWNTEHFIE